MSFWGSDTLSKQGRDLISPFDRGRIKHGAYELSLGPEVYITGAGNVRRLEQNEDVLIPVGQFAVLLTEEEVHVPAYAIAFISIKSRVKLAGLVNVSGFHVDPGFSGRLLFSVYNAGLETQVLRRGKATFQIWFADISNTHDPYDGKSQGQMIIPNEAVAQLQGSRVSPATLQKQVDSLRLQLWAVWGALAVLGALATGVAVNSFSTELNIQENRKTNGAVVPAPDGTPAVPNVTPTDARPGNRPAAPIDPRGNGRPG